MGFLLFFNCWIWCNFCLKFLFWVLSCLYIFFNFWSFGFFYCFFIIWFCKVLIFFWKYCILDDKVVFNFIMLGVEGLKLVFEVEVCGLLFWVFVLMLWFNFWLVIKLFLFNIVWLFLGNLKVLGCLWVVLWMNEFCWGGGKLLYKLSLVFIWRWLIVFLVWVNFLSNLL